MISRVFKKRKREIIIGVVTLIAGIILGAIFFNGKANTHIETVKTHNEKEHSKTVWTCSMHPQIRQEKSGKCPICGMDLIPLNTNNNEEADDSEISMTESAIKLAEIQTYTVKSGTPQYEVVLLGKIVPDERNIESLTARFGGRIEKLYVNFTGQEVAKGEKLASIYSPELNTVQQEFLDAVKYKSENPSYYIAVRNKLKLWDLTDEQINAIEKRNKPEVYFDILSPISGTITIRQVTSGDYIKEGELLFEVIDLSKVWIMFDAYESDLPWIKSGDKIKFTVKSLPGSTFTAKVSFIDPFIDNETRVAKVRVEISNPERSLKPGMFVKGILYSKAAASSNKLLIPKTSVLWTGKRSVVYVKVPGRKETSFVYREITTGAASGDFYVVTEGLKEGEVIASNGVFRIDASAQLAGKPSMMNPDGGKISATHNHENTMNDEEMKNTDNDRNGNRKKPVTEAKMKCAAGKCGG